MIICICRGKSDRDVTAAIENGATTIRELQACGIGDQCGSCHTSLRTMLAAANARSAEAASSAQPCPCTTAPAPAHATA